MKALNITLIILIFHVVACGNVKHIENQPENLDKTVEKITSSEENEMTTAILTNDWGLYRESVAMNIHEVEISGNKMTVKVSYSGGCKEHYFKMIGYQFTTTSIPTERAIKIYHDTNQDDCRELISDVLEFDISALGLDNATPVNLQLYGYEGDIIYTKN